MSSKRREEAFKHWRSRQSGPVIAGEVWDAACEWQSALAQQPESEPVEIWLGSGDKTIADIYDDEAGEWHGIGVFNAENYAPVGDRVPELDGVPISELSPIALIKTNNPKSLEVIILECVEAIEAMTGRPYAAPSIAEKRECEWTYEPGDWGTFKTGCGKKFVLALEYAGDMDWMEFCPFCGKVWDCEEENQ